MMDQTKPFFRAINELCEEMNIEISEYSFGLIKQLKRDGKIRSLVRYKLDLNSGTACDIANDKYATYEILKANKVPIIEHTMIFNPKTRKDYVTALDLQIAKALFNKYNRKMVIKANNSYQGKEVFLIDEEAMVEKTILDIFNRNNDSLSLCPFENLKNEYRVIVLDNECLFSYKKDKPVIKGDGKKSISDYLIDLKIEKPDKNLDLDYIPKQGEEVELNWKFNLSGGATPQKITDTALKYEIEKIAIQAAKAINIKFASVDIVENTNKELKVMEINATVCMNKFSENYENGYEISKEIYRKALEKCFE